MTYQLLLTSPVVEALGQSLLHFLWQGTLLGIALWSVQLMLPGSISRQTSARIRYIAACIVMLLMVLSLAVTIVHYYPSHAEGIRTVLRGPALTISPSVGKALPTVSAAARIGFAGWVVCFWLTGVLSLSVRFAGGWLQAQRMKRHGCQSVSPELAGIFERLKQELQVRIPVRLFVSSVARVPMVIGWIRPYILLPVTAMTGLTEVQLRLVLAHELSHIRRCDYLVNLLQTVVETALFYHPAVWWVSRQLRVERENCCDDQALEVCGDPAAYVVALAQMEEFRLQAPVAAVAATGGALLRRVRRMLEPARTTTHSVRKSLAAAVVAIFVMGTLAVPAVLTSGKIRQTSAPNSEAQPTTTSHVLSGVLRGVLKPQAEAAPQPPPPPPPPQRSAEKPLAGIFSKSGQANAGDKGPSEQSTELLLKLYDSSQDADVKGQILEYLANAKSPKASEKLLSAARSASDPTLRHRAIDVIGQRPDAFDALVSLYDSKPDLETRRHLMDYIGMSQDTRALDKLFSIAQSDPDLDIRRLAVDYIAMR
jgi:beta-lactamase regulating signal transducer with metallopeptidase domain